MSTRKPWYSLLYVQVIIAMIIGILIGHFFPETGIGLRPLGNGFIALITMMIAPIVFSNVVHGIASMGDMKKVGLQATALPCAARTDLSRCRQPDEGG